MAQTVDWVPKTYELFQPFSLNIKERAIANKLIWKLVDTTVTSMAADVDDFVADYLISSKKKTRSSNDVNNTKKSFKKARSSVRAMGIGQMKNNLNMTDEDRNLCGVINDSGSHTMSPVTDSSPAVIYSRTGELGGKMVFVDPESVAGGRPDGQVGTSVMFGFYPIGGTQPLEAECTMNRLYNTRLGGVTFPPAALGKSFIGYARYYNTRNVLGTIATSFKGIVS